MEVLLESLEQEWRGLIRLTPKIVMALVALLVSIGVGRVVARMLVGVLTRGNLSKVHLSFFKQLTQWSFLLLGVIIALNVLGLKGVAASLVAGGGVTAVVLGFAFRAIGENFLAGLSLIMGRTFKVGDVIRSGDFEGQVRGIELRHTHIRAADGRDIFIPSIEIFGKPLVNSCLTLSIVAGMSVSDLSQKTIANLGWDKIKLSAPVFAGDTVYAESEILDKRESKSRPNAGIVTARTIGKKADGTVFMSFERTMLIPKRGHAVDDKADY